MSEPAERLAAATKRLFARFGQEVEVVVCPVGKGYASTMARHKIGELCHFSSGICGRKSSPSDVGSGDSSMRCRR